MLQTSFIFYQGSITWVNELNTVERLNAFCLSALTTSHGVLVVFLRCCRRQQAAVQQQPCCCHCGQSAGWPALALGSYRALQQAGEPHGGLPHTALPDQRRRTVAGGGLWGQFLRWLNSRNWRAVSENHVLNVGVISWSHQVRARQSCHYEHRGHALELYDKQRLE